METAKLIVKVNASFMEGEELFSLLKKYARKHNNEFAFWDEFAFTVSDIPESDAVLIFNQPSRTFRLQTDPGKIIAFMMEPGTPAKHPWMFSGLDQYSKVYSPIAANPDMAPSHGYIGWYPEQNWSFFKQLPVPLKSKPASCISSDLKQLEGHRLRIAFINQLREEMPRIDFFGKGTRFLQNKLDGLLPYRYSLAIENSSATDYFSEKINDCFLSYTVPIYYGCTNIGKYFPEKSFIKIDIQKPADAIATIRELFINDDWQSRLTALQEARELILNKYQPLAGAAAILREIPAGDKKTVVLRPLPVPVIVQLKTFLKKIIAKSA